MFEGLSGSGKTECSKLLTKELRDRNYKVFTYHLNSFDNSLLVKMYEMINEIKATTHINSDQLTNNNKAQTNLPSYQRKQLPTDYVVIHTLFMLYLFSIRKDIMYKLSVCDYVIVDQWVYKNIVYSQLNKVPKSYISNMCRGVLPKPYLVILLDLHESDSIKRTKDLYEDKFTLQELKTNYYKIRQHAREKWLTVNLHGDETIEDIVYKQIIPKIKKNI